MKSIVLSLFILILCHPYLNAQDSKNDCAVLFDQLVTENNSKASSKAYQTSKALLKCLTKRDNDLVLNPKFSYHIGYAHKLSKKLDSALLYLEKTASNEASSNKILMDTYKEIADIYYSKNILNKFKKYVQKQLELALQEKDTSQIIDAQINLGFKYRLERKPDSSEIMYSNASLLSLAVRDSLLWGRIQILNSSLLQLKNENYKALQLLNQLEVFFKKKNNSTRLADVYYYMAINFRIIGRYEEAIYTYRKVLPLYKKDNQFNRMAAIHVNIANLHVTLNNDEGALQSYLKASELVDNFPRLECPLQNGLASSYINLNKFEKAFIHLKKAEEICGSSNNKFRMAEWNRIAGDYYYKKSDKNKKPDYKKAISYFNTALLYFQELHGTNGQINSLVNLAKVRLKMGEFQKTENLLKRAYKISQTLEDVGNQKLVLYELYKFYFEIENYKKGYSYFKEHESLEKDNFKVELSKKLEENLAYFEYKLQVKQDSLKNEYRITLKNTQLKEKEKVVKAQSNAIFIISFILLVLFILALIIFKRNNQLNIAKITIETQKNEVELQRDQLEKTIQELVSTQEKLLKKERLAAIGALTQNISHELRNPLHFIGTASNILKSKKAETLKTQDTEKLLNTIAEGVKRMVSTLNGVHAAVSAEFKQQEIDLTTMVQHVINDISEEVKNNIGFTSTLTKPYLLNADKNSLKEIIQSIIQNSIEAIEYKGNVEISLIEKNDMYELSFKDDGKGMSQASLKKVLEPFYSTKKQVSGVGLSLFKSYTKLKSSGGNLSIASELGKGTTVTLSLKRVKNN